MSSDFPFDIGSASDRKYLQAGLTSPSKANPTGKPISGASGSTPAAAATPAKTSTTAKKKGGRPKGSKNKPKIGPSVGVVGVSNPAIGLAKAAAVVAEKAALAGNKSADNGTPPDVVAKNAKAAKSTGAGLDVAPVVLGDVDVQETPEIQTAELPSAVESGPVVSALKAAADDAYRPELHTASLFISPAGVPSAGGSVLLEPWRLF